MGTVTEVDFAAHGQRDRTAYSVDLIHCGDQFSFDVDGLDLSTQESRERLAYWLRRAAEMIESAEMIDPDDSPEAS